MTRPDKPNSRLQCYYLTTLGKQMRGCALFACSLVSGFARGRVDVQQGNLLAADEGKDIDGLSRLRVSGANFLLAEHHIAIRPLWPGFGGGRRGVWGQRRRRGK